MQTSEVLELLALVEKEAEAVRKSDKENPPELSRCLEALERLIKEPRHHILRYAVVDTLRIIENHTNHKIRRAAYSLKTVWRGTVLIDTVGESREKVRTKRAKDLAQDPVGDSREKVPTKMAKELAQDPVGDSRMKVRTKLAKALAQVAAEAEGETKDQVLACDPSEVAAEVESEMFKKFGPCGSSSKNNYLSIVFNLEDKDNPDLRRKVLLGEITGERLLMLKKKELASDKMQKNIQQVEEKLEAINESQVVYLK